MPRLSLPFFHRPPARSGGDGDTAPEDSRSSPQSAPGRPGMPYAPAPFAQAGRSPMPSYSAQGVPPLSGAMPDAGNAPAASPLSGSIPRVSAPSGLTGQVPQGTGAAPVQASGYAPVYPPYSGAVPAGYSAQMPPFSGAVPAQGTASGYVPANSQFSGSMPAQGYAPAGAPMGPAGYGGATPPFAPGYSQPLPPQASGAVPSQAAPGPSASRESGEKKEQAPGGGAPSPEGREKQAFKFRPSFHPSDAGGKKVSLTAFQWAIMAAAVLLTGWYLFTTYAPQAQTTARIVYSDFGTSHPGEALIVRNETPYDADSVTSIRYIAEEGAEAISTADICEVFSSGFSTREMTALQDYRDQIRDYEQELLSEETTYDAQLERVESEVLTQAKEVRNLLSGAKGNLLNLEAKLKQAVLARQQYLRTKYNEDQRLSRLLDDESAQQQRIDSWTKQYKATKSSLISFYTDGYEYGLTIGNCLSFSPSEVRSMINGSIPAGAASLGKSKTTIYRTISDDVWYCLMLCRDTSWNPEELKEYDLELNQFEDTHVRATVVGYTRSGGELLVQLRIEGNVESVLYMRTGTVVLSDSQASFMVPSRALYSQDNMIGVVIIDGSNQFFVPVEVIANDGKEAFIKSLQNGLLFENQEIKLF